MADSVDTWRRVASEEGPDYGIFRVRIDTSVSPRTGREGRYVVLDCPDWVNVIAMTDDDRVVLVRQFRHGTSTVDLEIPAGMIDRDEDPLEAAQRELAEETGYSTARWRLLGRIRPNPAFQNNWCYHYVAEGVRKTGEPQLDPGEDIVVEHRPLSAIPDLISRGEISHVLVLSAFYFLTVFDQHNG